jgi:CubicO group peptidase (beta-lactamase class C family)
MSQCVDAVVQRDFTPAGLARNQTRAVVVVHRGQIISEGYQLAMGITQDTKLLGWSMTKSLHTAVVGAAIQQGFLTLDTPVQLQDLDEAHRRELIALNGGRALTFRDLLQMKDVLRMEEKYGIFDDVSTMLYGSTDAGRFASQQVRKPITAPDAKDKEATFGWYYSSGLSYIPLPHDHVEKRKKVWMTQVLPADAYAMNGYLGQNTMIIPSEELVIARLGYTPDAPEGAPPTWDPKAFYGDILTCFQGLDFYPVAN